MNPWVLGTVLGAVLFVASCSPPDSSPKIPVKATGVKAPANAPASIVNRVWAVAESQQVAPGELRVFLSEGTLVMASPHGTPALGRWRYHDGRLTITEEGVEHATGSTGAAWRRKR